MTALERYFYHSFPRSRGDEKFDLQKGLKILESITDFGLVLTPEATHWEYPHRDGSPPRTMEIAQRRVCFTELEPKNLPEHAKIFGSFALEFEIDTLKALHAMPVFYIPRGETSSLGQTLVIQLIDAMCLIDRMAKVKGFAESTTNHGRQNFTFGFSDRQKLFNLDLNEAHQTIEGVSYAITPPEMLSLALEGALNLFYPADADPSREDSTLRYYRQREWRIAGNIGHGATELMGLPSPALVDRLLEIDADFYGKEFPTSEVPFTNPSLVTLPQGKRIVDWVFVYQGIDDRHIVGAARRVIVPRDAMDIARKILAKHPKPPPVLPIEDLI